MIGSSVIKHILDYLRCKKYKVNLLIVNDFVFCFYWASRFLASGNKQNIFKLSSFHDVVVVLIAAFVCT